MKPEAFVANYCPRLFHFTDVRNLDLIRAHGLLSVSQLDAQTIIVPRPGGNAWSREADSARGLHEYVHLCLTDNHPMEYVARESGHIGATRYLQIDPRAILQPGVMGCAMVANHRDACVLPLAEALEQIDLEILYRVPTNFSNPAFRKRYNEAKKSEILIPARVDPRFILNL